LVVEQLDELHGAREFDFVNDVVAKVTARILFRMLRAAPETIGKSAARYSWSSPMEFQAEGAEHIAAYNWMQEYAAGVIAASAATHRRSDFTILSG